MFTDARSRKVILVSHSILNQNSISDGTADFRAVLKGIVTLLMKNEIGIIQMPCPELHCLGLDRGNVHGAERRVVVENSRIRKALMKPSPLRTMKALVRHIIRQIEEYRSNGFLVVGIVGINRSPSCGVVEDFLLEQNFPNPFYPSTTIKFHLSRPSTIVLQIIDMLNRRVGVLAEGLFGAGDYRLKWIADVPSGICFLCLTANGRSETKKVMFLR